MRNEEGRDNLLAIHVTLLPYIGSTGEIKTKPTQHSVRRAAQRRYPARRHRLSQRLRDDARRLKDKIALFCDVEKRAVVPLRTMSSIYQVPLVLEEAGLGDFVVERLGLL